MTARRGIDLESDHLKAILYQTVTVQTTPERDPARIVKAPAGAREFYNSLNPTPSRNVSIDAVSLDLRPDSSSSHAVATASIAAFGLKHNTPVLANSERVLAAQRPFGAMHTLVSSTIEAMKSRNRQSAAESFAAEELSDTGRSQDRRLYGDGKPLQNGNLEALASKFNLPDRSSTLALTSLGDSTRHVDGKQDPRNRRPKSEREFIWGEADDGFSAEAGSNRSAHATIFGVFDDLERLRAALAQTIDDLGRIRGSVQLNQRALPPNRGAFRVS